MNMISKDRDAAFYTIDDIADLLQITNKAVRHRIARGGSGKDIPPFVKIGGLIRFKVSDTQDWYQNLV